MVQVSNFLLNMNMIEPQPYGTDFSSVEELTNAVEERVKTSKPLFGHAVIWLAIPGSELFDRVGATINDNGDITVGAHGEYC